MIPSLEAAERAAKEFDRGLVDKQEAAYEAHYWDYAAIVAQDVPPVLEEARAILGPRVRQLHEASQLLPATATRADIEKLCGMPGLKAIWLDPPIEPQLDVSRLSIEADRVHNGEVGGIPYTGAGVKVAVVDTGLAPDHPRLPVPSAANQKNFACRDGRDATDWCDCNAWIMGHRTSVAGVIFTQPDPCCDEGDCTDICEDECDDECDDYLGIAYDATFVMAKMFHDPPDATCACNRTCATCESEDYYEPTWSLIVEGLSWAATLPSAIGPNADVVTCSLATQSYSGYSNTTAEHITSRNVDWIIQTGGSPITQAAGNEGANGLVPPNGAYNLIAVANFHDNNTEIPDDNYMASMSSYGPTFDGRRKPDLCGPGEATTTTRYCWVWPNLLFEARGGTSIATPYAAGTLALLKEARSSLTPRQLHAILLNATVPLGSQSDWEVQAGWGQLNAYNAVLWRNRTADGTLTDPDDSETFQLSTVPADDEVVVTLAWHRAMENEADPAEDGDGNPSPASLELFLERKLSGGNWELVEGDVVPPNGSSDGNPEDNVRRVTAAQAPQGQSQYQFRVRVEHNPTTDSPYEGSQGFSLASRHALAAAP